MLILKRIALIATCGVITVSCYAQSTTTPVKKTTSAKQTALTPEKSKMFCKAWKLDTISEFGVDNKAKGKEANDGITLVADGSLFLTQEGVTSTGTWTYAGGRINTVTTSPDNKLSFKVMSISDARMVLEYQNPAPDLSRIQYTYSLKK
jgi:hypothetical protein